MTQATARSTLGVAKETTKGTAVAPTDFMPVTKIEPEDHLVMLEDKGLRGSMAMVYNEVAGPLWSEIAYGGDFFPDATGYAIAGLFGDVTVTGASAPFTHAFSIKNSTDGQPISYTLTDYDILQARAFAGFQHTDLSVTFNADGLLTYDTKGIGLGSATATSPTPSFSTVTPMPAWACTFKIAGTTVGFLTKATITYTRNGTPIHAADNSQAPYKLWVGPMNVTGSFTLVMETETELTNYLTNTQQSLSFDWSQGAGAALVEYKHVSTKAAYTLAKRTRSADYEELDIDFTAIANSTDAGASGGLSPAKVTLQNAKASGTYI